MEPLQLGVLAGMTPEDIDVVMYDDRMEEVPFDEPTDLVGITVEVYTAGGLTKLRLNIEGGEFLSLWVVSSDPCA